MQHTLQAGLSAGMSATEGFHSSKPKPVNPSFDGLQSVLPPDFVPSSDIRITLHGANGNDVHVSPICIGAWPWGDVATWHWKPEERPAVDAAWDICAKHGINFIDTAQAYGDGESERITGELAKRLSRDKVVVQTKYYVVPDMENILHPSTAPVKKLQGSLERLGMAYVDIYLVHGPIHPGSISQVAKGMAECVEKGLAKCIGVANYSKKDMLEMKDALAKYGIPLATNQVEFHPLRRIPETSGLLQACKDNGIVLQSYSSLAQGRLTGKYGPGNEPPKTYRFSSYPMKDIEPMLDVLKRIAVKRGTSVSSISLNYNMSKGVLPVVGIRNPQQAEENVKALGWRLSNEEIKEIDSVSVEGKTTVLWQQG